MSARGQRILILSDFLPPDFGAAGAYALVDARRWARQGHQVTLIGLSAGSGGLHEEPGLRILRLSVSRRPVPIAARAAWMARVYPRLLKAAMGSIKAVDEVVFGAGLPYFELCMMPLILRGGRRFVLRLTDFHPECLIATYGRDVPRGLTYLQQAVNAARARMNCIEVGGDDQRKRLLAYGMAESKVVVRRDGLPVCGIGPDVPPQPLPPALRDRVVLLYSGNLGRAHDVHTLCEAYRLHHTQGSGSVYVWLNAVGVGAEQLEARWRLWGLPFHRSRPGPLSELPALLATPAAHIITLKDEFVGYVIPSKVYGALSSGRAIVFVGSTGSDVHPLCTQARDADAYHQVDPGDVDGLARVLELLSEHHGLSSVTA